MSEQPQSKDSLVAGAAESAPVAPHATPSGAVTTRAARFWRGRGVRIAFVACLVASTGAHYAMFPFGFMPSTSMEFKDVDDELTIPTDLIEDTPPPQVAEPEPPQTPVGPQDPNADGPGKPDAAPPPKKKDAGAPEGGVADAGAPDDGGEDASPRDAGEARDAAVALSGEAGVPVAETDAGAGDGGGGSAIAKADPDAGIPGAGGPRDPGSMIGMAGLVSAGTVNVTLLVNMQVIRSHPVGARLGPLLAGLPQWNDFIRGNETNFDPVRDTDWMLIYGPSLINTDRDAMLIHYSVPDATVDHAIDLVSAKYDQGGAYDAGVPGVKATLGHADNAQRVFIRAQPHVLAVVPPDKARDFAKVLKARTVNPKVRPGEALRLVVKDPHRQVAIRGLSFPKELKELRLWIVPRADGGADVYGEGDCTSEDTAASTATTLTDVISRTNSGLVQMGTAGLLNGAKVEAEGSGVHLHISASRTQLDRVLGTVALLLGVELK